MADDIAELVRDLRNHRMSPRHGGCEDCYGIVMDDAADALERLSAENARYRKALEIIAGQSRHVFEAMQARTALSNIGAPVGGVKP